MALEKIEGWSIREVLGGGAEGEEEELEGEYEEGWEEREKMEVREEGVSEGMEALLRIGVTKGMSVLTYGRGELMKIEDLMRSIGTILAQLHSTGIIHGDLTTSNMMLRLTPNSPSGKTYEIVSYRVPRCASGPADKTGVDRFRSIFPSSICRELRRGPIRPRAGFCFNTSSFRRLIRWSKL